MLKTKQMAKTPPKQIAGANSRPAAGSVFFAVVAFAAFLYYSWTWSEKFLAAVHVGMTKSQVQKFVGVPPRTRPEGDGAVTWDYGHSWSRDARVYFDTNGVVWAVETD